MKVLLFDPIPGASGDMILAALIDAGVPRKYLVDQLSFIPDFTMKLKRAVRNGVSGRQVRFNIKCKIKEKEFLPLIRKSPLSDWVKDHAIKTVERIFEVERHVHRAKKLHLHELADADTLLDICGALAAIEYLNVDRIHSRSLKAGTGYIKTVEGNMPAFNFATAYLLQHHPVEFMPIPAELTTPTGAAIITTVASFTESLMLSKIDRIGMGVGTMRLQDHPNVLRIFIGSRDTCCTDTCTVFETNIDDMNPQDFESVIEKLYKAGALEVMITPSFMKKIRPGVMITVICTDNQTAIRNILLRHTTTLGIRMHETKRWKLRRTNKRIATPLGRIRVKLAWIEDEMHFTIEYRDIQRIARTHNRSLPAIRAQLTRFVAEKLSNPH